MRDLLARVVGLESGQVTAANASQESVAGRVGGGVLRRGDALVDVFEVDRPLEAPNVVERENVQWLCVCA
ncbi:MAG: hypothetical protein M3174_02135 [Actinomycetota bacterium]|nr:hypothetical protein [Actinomycetota bacterium]